MRDTKQSHLYRFFQHNAVGIGGESAGHLGPVELGRSHVHGYQPVLSRLLRPPIHQTRRSDFASANGRRGAGGEEEWEHVDKEGQKGPPFGVAGLGSDRAKEEKRFGIHILCINAPPKPTTIRTWRRGMRCYRGQKLDQRLEARPAARVCGRRGRAICGTRKTTFATAVELWAGALELCISHNGNDGTRQRVDLILGLLLALEVSQEPGHAADSVPAHLRLCVGWVVWFGKGERVLLGRSSLEQKIKNEAVGTDVEVPDYKRTVI